jgi:hypothetical protein
MTVFVTSVISIAALLVAGIILVNNPISTRRARAGEVYRVGSAERTIPNLRFGPTAPWLVREPVLDAMARLLEYADRTLTAATIPYWISCGTLLGAVRHRGFIPWDDDIDVQVPHEAAPKLLALKEQFRRDGFVLVEAAGGYKLAYANFWRFPYIDVAIVERSEGRLKLCYPLNANGQPTFEKARQWPNECLPVDDVLPLTRVAFEHFAVAAPGRIDRAVEEMYGHRSLTEVPGGGGVLPWVVNHRTDSMLLKLGLIEG